MGTASSIWFPAGASSAVLLSTVSIDVAQSQPSRIWAETFFSSHQTLQLCHYIIILPVGWQYINVAI
eukprot:scaffold586306_cov32-Prasinocladus_malaysianus.AAC.1